MANRQARESSKGICQVGRLVRRRNFLFRRSPKSFHPSILRASISLRPSAKTHSPQPFLPPVSFSPGFLTAGRKRGKYARPAAGRRLFFKSFPSSLLNVAPLVFPFSLAPPSLSPPFIPAGFDEIENTGAKKEKKKILPERNTS